MNIINQEYIKNYLIDNKIIFPTNSYDNELNGFQNYGPNGLKIKNNIIDIWRKIFINDDTMFEIETPVILNEKVLDRSGHIQKFNDLGIIFYEKETTKIFQVKRADHYIEDKIQELNLNSIIYCESEDFILNFMNEYNLIETNAYIEVRPISLMYKFDLLNENLYLRPEIAQSMFIEFKQFYDYNNNKLPFGIGQIGKSYRNEISGKQFLRLREFTQAEIEYFYNPFNLESNKEYHILDEYKNKKCYILTKEMNLTDEKYINLIELNNYVKNPILLKFIVKVYIFVERIGLDISKIRFRQHKENEMAHYSKDCWDLEAKIFNKWLEIIGISDRGDYDLRMQDKNNLLKIKKYSEPEIKYKLIPKKKYIFKNYSKDDAIKLLNNLEKEIIINTKEETNNYNLKLYEIEEFKYYEMIYPNVIEPSIGIDRVFYSLVAHNLNFREGTTRPYILLSKYITPYSFMLAQLSNHKDLINKFNQYKTKLQEYNIYIDLSSTSIGKRYTRADELGINYSITIDFETLNDDTITIRFIKTMEQQRIHFNDIKNYIMSNKYN